MNRDTKSNAVGKDEPNRSASQDEGPGDNPDLQPGGVRAAIGTAGDRNDPRQIQNPQPQVQVPEQKPK